jgi:Tfp pilus assembly protein PilO
VQLYPVAINITGSFTSIQNFLKKIENAARFVTVDGGDLLGTASGNAVDARISLTAYYQTGSTK